MKTTKRILALVLTIVALVSVMAVGAYADTSDTYPAVSVSPSVFVRGEVRPKDNSSRIYYVGLNCVDDHTLVQARGSYSTSSAASYTNVTVANGCDVLYVVCRKGVEYSISSEVNEKGYTYASLFFRRFAPNGATAAIRLEYKWSPDSSGTYIPAT